MALNKAVVHIPLGGGKNEGVHEHLIDAPKVADLRNCHFDKQGTLTKRFGFKALSTDNDPNFVHSLFNHNNAVHAITDVNSIYFYSEKDKTWTATNTYGVTPHEVRNKSLIATDVSVYNPDIAVCNGYVCATWEQDGRTWYLIEEEESELVRVPPSRLNLYKQPKVCTIKDRYFCIFAKGSVGETETSLAALTIDTETSNFARSSIKNLNPTTMFYDVSSEPTGSYVFGVSSDVQDGASSETHVWKFDESGFVASGTLTGTGYNSDYGRAVYYDSFLGDKFFVATMLEDPLGSPVRYQVKTTMVSESLAGYTTPTTAIEATSGSITPRASGSYIGLGRYDAFNLAVVSSVFFSPDNVSNVNFSNTNLWATTHFRLITDNTNTTTSIQDSIRNMHLAAKPFEFSSGNSTRAVVPLEYHHTLTGSTNYQNTQPALLYTDPNGTAFRPLAKNNTDISFNRFNVQEWGDKTGGHLSNVVSSSHRGFIHGSTVLRKVLGSTDLFPGQRTHIRTNINESRFNLAQSPIISHHYDRNTLFANGYFGTYDGVESCENNIYFAPVLNGFITNNAKAPVSTSNGVVVHKYIDNQGYVHRSAPSNVRTFDWGVGLTASYQTPVISSFDGVQNHKITTELYITPPTQSNTNPSYHLVREFEYQPSPETSGDENNVQGLYDFSDPGPEQLETRPELYTAGGILASTSPPGFVDFTVAKNRVFGISQEDRNQVWYSKWFEPGIAPEFNGNLVITDNTGDEQEFVAISHFQQKIILFKNRSIYYLGGEGPNNAGAGQQFIGPTLIADNIGCVNKHSVQETPVGVTFQSDEGIYLYNGSLSFIGQPIEDSLGDKTITSTTVDEKQSLITFTTNEDVVFVYDYKRKEWALHDYSAKHAVMIDNKLAVFSGSNKIAQSEDDYYLDTHENGIVQSFETGWIKPGNLQGFGRLWKISLLGKRGPGKTTNLLSYSEQFGQWNAIVVGGTIETSETETPTGYGQAYSITDDFDNFIAGRSLTAPIIKNKNYKWTGWIEKDSVVDRQPAFAVSLPNGNTAVFNINTNAGTSNLSTNDLETTPTMTITSHDNNWWFVEFDFISNVSGDATFSIYPAYVTETESSDGDVTTEGTTTFFGLQLEQTSVFTQYVKTEGSAASHNNIGPLKVSLYFNYDGETVHQTKYYDEYNLRNLKRLQVAFMPKYQKIESFKLKLEELDSSDGKPGNVSGWRWSSIALEYGQDGGLYKYTTPNSFP